MKICEATIREGTYFGTIPMEEEAVKYIYQNQSDLKMPVIILEALFD